MKLARLLVLLAPLMLLGCVLSPGKFVSSLDIRKDRSFTFSYVGEVILLDPNSAMREGMASGMASGDGDEEGDKTAAAPAAPTAEETARTAAERQAIVEALRKEEGYRSVEHVGGNVFRVDYQTGGRLDRNFVYPVNLDAKSIIPWIAVEVRKDGTARVKAIAFGDPDEGMGSMAKPDKPDNARQGTFTLTTDAALVMQNNEEGMAPGPGTRVVWKVTPASKTVPTAVVKF